MSKCPLLTQRFSDQITEDSWGTPAVADAAAAAIPLAQHVHEKWKTTKLANRAFYLNQKDQASEQQRANCQRPKTGASAAAAVAGTDKQAKTISTQSEHSVTLPTAPPTVDDTTRDQR